MNTEPDPVSVVKYDAVTRMLCEHPQPSHEHIAKQCSVAVATVERIFNGNIPRPAVVVLDRLTSPRRCPECGALCRDWPCIFCEIRRRREGGAASATPRFQYRSQSK